jgi:CheY-like chemotaxis protein
MGEWRMRGTGKPCVLVVDDDLETRESIAELLVPRGFAVLTAADGHEALRRLHEQPDVRLIVLDILMPGMDGTAFRMAQLENRAFAHIPFILLTDKMDCANIAEALGAAACFRKPYPVAELLRAIERFR